jgi:type IV secretion system protein TrbC
MKSRKNKALTIGLSTALLGVAMLFPEQAHAGGAGGGGLPWETPLQTITQSLQGPVAYAISLLGIISCGGMLIWGGEINEFMRRGIMLVLVISLVIFASSVLSSLFSAAGAAL